VYPPALYNSSLLLHKADKPALTESDANGGFVKMAFQQISQMMAFSMSWMVERFYNAFHDLVVLQEIYVTSTQKM